MGSLFHCDNPIMAMLTKIGNMMIVSLFWLIACIPIFTIIPACAALYHTMVKIVRCGGNGVAHDFFAAFKANFKQGIGLSIFCAGAWFVLYTCLDFGWQLRATALGTAYLAIAIVICVIAAGVCMWIAPVISRFDGKLIMVLRLAGYFAMRHPLYAIFVLAMFAFSLFCCWFYPVLVLLIPGIFVDMVCTKMEKIMNTYTQKAFTCDNVENDEQNSLPQLELPTAIEQAQALEKQ